MGFTFQAGTVIWGTLLQRRVPPALLGRVSSLDFFVSLALMPVSMALAGPVGEQIGIPATFVIAGVVPPFLALAAVVAFGLLRDEIEHPLDLASGPPGDRAGNSSEAPVDHVEEALAGVPDHVLAEAPERAVDDQHGEPVDR
ncbi:hypothetical protein [Naasia aerilata]|uniref:hypothetical protein n=1 Tax=Naasia aerilata TaxID=1162966 RepID=UPI003306807F